MKQIRKTRLEHQLEGGVLKQLNESLAKLIPSLSVVVERAEVSIPPARAAYNVVSVMGETRTVIRAQVTINEVKIFLEGALAFLPHVA